MAQGKLEFLSSSEIERINGVSLRILEEVGIVVNSRSVADMLIRSGSRRSKDTKRVLIPESIVKSAISSAPKTMVLASRDGKRDLRIPTEGPMFIANGGEGVYVKDLLTGVERPSTTEDLTNFVSLVDRLPQIDFCWSMVGALDQPNRKKNPVEVMKTLQHTTKHVQGGDTSADEARWTLEMLKVLTGDLDEFAKHPFYSAVQCPISPLTFEEGLVDAQVELSRAGVPVVAMVASVAGLTSPVTLAGTLAQVNAEGLASLVISQTAKKGSPWIYSSDSSPGDLRTGSISYHALEATLLRTGAAQIGRHHGFPTMCGGASLEEESLALSNVAEGVPYMMTEVVVPTDLGSGLGGLDQAAGASFEQLLADAWVWDVAKDFTRTFSSDAAAISFETIRDAALDRNFLGKRHTLTSFKRESAAVTKPDAAGIGAPSSGNRMDLLRKAQKEVRKMLAEPRKPLTTDEQNEALQKIIDRI